MDAYAGRHEALSHRDATLVVLGVLLPTFMGSLDQTILANALPTIGRDFKLNSLGLRPACVKFCLQIGPGRLRTNEEHKAAMLAQENDLWF
jgi:hypothetical protein